MVFCFCQIRLQVPAGWQTVSQAAAILTVVGHVPVWHEDISAYEKVVSQAAAILTASLPDKCCAGADALTPDCCMPNYDCAT